MSRVATQSNVPRVAVVIGGKSGIGLATVKVLEAEGWKVLTGDVSEPHNNNASDVGHFVDVTRSETINIFFEWAKNKYGRVDAVVNTAGFTNQSPTPLVTDDDWDNLVGVHLGGSFKVARAAFSVMKESGGSIVNISSVAGSMGLPFRASYCASKAGIEGLTRSLAVEFAEFGIRVNAVAPGWIQTQLTNKDLDSGLVSEAVLKTRISLRRLGKAEEVADLVSFLCSVRSSYITGQTVAVDGGLTIDLDPGDRRAALGSLR